MYCICRLDLLDIIHFVDAISRHFVDAMHRGYNAQRISVNRELLMMLCRQVNVDLVILHCHCY